MAKNLQLNYAWNNRLLAGLITKKGSTSTQPTTATSNTSTTSTTLGSKTKITASASNYSIRIKKPSGLSASAVSCTDDYSNKRLRTSLMGTIRLSSVLLLTDISRNPLHTMYLTVAANLY